MKYDFKVGDILVSVVGEKGKFLIYVIVVCVKSVDFMSLLLYGITTKKAKIGLLVMTNKGVFPIYIELVSVSLTRLIWKKRTKKERKSKKKLARCKNKNAI